MSKFQAAFTKGKAVMAFITCGDPDLETTAKVIDAAIMGGADIIELNIPFSDPTAVDPVIQQANVRSLEKGITTDAVFDFVKQYRKKIPVPVIFSSYANVVFSYGAEKFIRTCQEIGVEGLLIPDVPFEERQEFLPLCQQYGVTLIPMVAVTSRERVVAICQEAQDLLYIMACPGTREQELVDMMALVRANTKIPTVICLTGTEESRIAVVAEKTDGVAVDVPLVRLVAEHGTNAVGPMQRCVADLKATINLAK